MDTIALGFAIVAYLYFAWRRLRRYLHIFQQEEYSGPRFLDWIARSAAFDKRLSGALAGLLLIAWIGTANAWPTTTLALAGVALLASGLLEPDPERAAKKKLVMTNRAWRILGVAMTLAVVLAGVVAVLRLEAHWTLLALIVAIQILPLALVAANLCLIPVETHIQNGFRRAAESRLRAVGPKVVGITGSFGKTSVKHILGHVLEMTTNTLYTPGSVNTVMGIARIINERLRDNCRFFLVEMGAYGVGSIERLCKFTPPDQGIITSIGAAHYERFKDLDTVARAKFELAEAVVARNGRMVIHTQVLDEPYARSFVDRDRDRFVIVGESPEADVKVRSVVQKQDGLHVEIAHGPAIHRLYAPLYGLHHGHNMALAFAFAVEMGQSPAHVVQALRSTPQIAHRLELKSLSSGARLLDDAYNSNPSGFANALDLLDTLRRPGGRRILVTPGVAELGARHDEVHADLGRKAAHKTDITIAVRPERIAAFTRTFTNAGTDAELIECDRFDEAQQWLDANLGPEDIVLIENDLPDVYERVFKT